MVDSTETGAGADLTKRQRAILTVIRESVATRGYPPSIREIGDAVGLKSLSSVTHQLNQLELAGYLRRDPNRPRALEVLIDVPVADDASTSTPVGDAAMVPLVGRIAAGVPITAEQQDLWVFAYGSLMWNPGFHFGEVRRACLPGLLARAEETGDASELNMASMASSIKGFPNRCVYGATKAFVLSFSEALWAEERKHGIRVLAVCPGATATEFFDVAGESAAVGIKRTAKQVVDNTMRELAGKKPSFVDGVANAVTARVLTRVVPSRVLIAVTGRLMGGN